MAILERIIIYPVKGLGGIELTESAVESRGLRLDRRWMLTDSENVFITQRKFPQLARVRVSVSADCLTLETDGMPPLAVPLAPPGSAPVDVQVWSNVCAALPVGREADEWFTQFLGQPTRLVHMPETTRRPVNPKYAGPDDIVSFADGYPVLAISEESLADLNSRLEGALPMERFRPNLVVSGVDAYAEDFWTEVTLPGAAFRGAKPCGRCTVTTVDHVAGVLTGPEPLRTLAQFRRGDDGEVHFGENLLVAQPGKVRVGDRLTFAPL